MHIHKCRYCQDSFICKKGADECFAETIICNDCFWVHRAKWVWLSIAAVLGLTIFLVVSLFSYLGQ